MLREGEAFRILGLIESVDDTRLDAWADAAARAAAAKGIVGIVDYEMAWNPGVWSRRQASGTDSLRVETGSTPNTSTARSERASAPAIVWASCSRWATSRS